MDTNKLWQKVLNQLQINISQINFISWLRNTKIISEKNNIITVGVSNIFVKEWLEKKHNKIILKSLRKLRGDIKFVKYLIEPSLNRLDKKQIKIREKELLKKEELKKYGQLEFEQFRTDRKTNLNQKYRFDNFVVGSFNELAHACSLAVSEKPGIVYNPLFIYGGVGLGKTHLIQAIGNKITKNFQKLRVKYLSSEKFTSQIINSLRENTIAELKRKYQKIDILIIDDIEFLAGKDKTQEIFFHIFNFLYEKNKQIIISSDRAAKAIPAISERLRSRFEGGMMADISAPDFETKIAILKSKCLEMKVLILDEVLEYIASNIPKNIRELEGCLNKLITKANIKKTSIDLNFAKKTLHCFFYTPKKVVSSKKIIISVASFYDLQIKDLLKKTRKKEIVKARQIAMYLLKQELKESFSSIGRKFGGKDHTTVMHAYNKIKKNSEENQDLHEEIKLITQRIYSG